MSLEKSIRTCSVDSGQANRIQSDRFFNPNNMVCIPWNNIDSTGRTVSPDSFYTKTAGCDSAEDRVMVENALRPQYFSYVTLGAQGVRGNVYGDQMDYDNAVARTKFDYSRNKITGNFGKDFGSSVRTTSCSLNGYERGMAQLNQLHREETFLQNGAMANSYQRYAGNR